jgi:hypothetical protein
MPEALAAVAQMALATAPQARKLRVGLFVDTRLQPLWAIEAFAKVACSEFAEVALIAAVARGDPLRGPREPLLWKLYGGLDRWAFRAGDDPAERGDVIAGVPHRLFFQLGGERPVFDKALDLDVAFALGEVDDSALDGIARYGVWRFYFGEGGVAGGHGEALAGWQEVAEGTPLTGSGLKVRLAPGAAPRFAYQSWSRTYPFSAARNRAQLLRKTTQFAWRALRELHRAGDGWLEQCKPVKEIRGQSPNSHSGSRSTGVRALTPNSIS